MFPCQVDPKQVAFDQESLVQACFDTDNDYLAIEQDGQPGLVPRSGVTGFGEGNAKVLCILKALNGGDLGSKLFREVHGLQASYVAGAMANGIGSEEIVIEMAKHGMLGFFGAGGLHPRRVLEAIHRIKSEVGDKPFGFNLLHNPFEPSIEEKTVEMYLEHEITRVSAAAYLGLTPYIVHYRLSGLKRNSSGKVVAKNHIFAKVSRSEVARAFMAPAPEKMITRLFEQGKITAEEAELAREIPMASDITAEADSGGHTDNRPLVTLLPTFLNLRDAAMAEFKYSEQIRVGAAGGISTPHSVECAFAMGADYVLTGSVNQAALEAGTSDFVRDTLSKLEPHDVIMAPAADMFEMGVKLQVVKKGSMFAMRSQKLYQLYTSCASVEEIPQTERLKIEKQIFQKSLDQVWAETKSFFEDRDPSQLVKAAQDSKHKMALIFRWYLGKSSLWAIQGVPERKMDYQIWAGPSMGAFNEWTRNSFLAEVQNRKIVDIARNLLRGAAILSRVEQLKNSSFPVIPEMYQVRPVPMM